VQNGVPLEQVVQTKLHPPRLRDEIIVRRPLLQRLHDTLLTHRVTVISAPAGYGKTSLLGGLAQQYPELPLAWLSLDALDNDSTSFLATMIAALQQIEPAFGAGALAQLTTIARPPVEPRRVVGALINDVLQTIPRPFVVVLDDLHEISAAPIHEALDYLLEHLPPQMHVAIAARHAPPLALPRLRARGHLAEFHLDDLRFTPAETAALLNERYRLDLSAEQLSALQTQSEG
jgi:LuxR family transcriptional regulator, maltose regulon positive regulatory protein